LTSYVVASDEGPHRRYYGVTEQGRAQLEASRAAWIDFSRVLTNLLDCHTEVTV
jgi:PadR family transcriptional regulator PadR